MEQNQNNRQNQFKCTGDCLNCRKLPNERREQWQYCSAQFTFNSMRMLEKMVGALESMQCQIDDMKTKIEAIQNSEASVYDPTSEYNMIPKPILETNDTSQEGSGVIE